MRIVNKQEFYNLPKGAVCAKYEPCIFQEPFIKGESLSDKNGEYIDYYYQPLLGFFDAYELETLLDNTFRRARFSFDFDVELRDGLFDKEQFYAVWEKEDIQSLFNLVKTCLGDEE